MEYYYTPKENVSENSLVIDGDEAEHLNKVLRKSTGEEIYVTDGQKNVYKTVIENISKSKIDCKIVEKYFDLNEPKIQIKLYQSILKNPARFEFVIEKATELGVYEVNPIITETVVNKKRDKSANKLNRWQSIALSAMKQSQRCYLPFVNHPQNFDEAVKSCNTEIKIIAHEKVDMNDSVPTLSKGGQGGFIPDLAQSKSISVFIGPEGGFTDKEIELALSNGFKLLNLGKRKYRSETAAIVVMSLLSV